MSAAKKKSGLRKSAKAKARTAKPKALKNTVRANLDATATLKYLSWNDVEVEAMNPLLGRQLIVGHQVMLARVLLKKGCIVPLHSHINEQLSYILEGALKFYIDGKEIVVRAGESTLLKKSSRGLSLFHDTRSNRGYNDFVAEIYKSLD